MLLFKILNTDSNIILKSALLKNLFVFYARKNYIRWNKPAIYFQEQIHMAKKYTTDMLYFLHFVMG